MALARAFGDTARDRDRLAWARTFSASRIETLTWAAEASVKHWTSALASPLRRLRVRLRARIRRPTARERSRTRAVTLGTAATTLRPARASTRTASAANPISVG